ncbi:DMT family transporter [Mesorhizobium sp. ZC-5]|uniref:DMT family transporter n=1 Tax=Mesorhizobium sp. ZC-5 TaxID=2986066 RepID=UPI0021E8CDD6|nr:DMT family transporter [Mesorhizobium sp. ZC-5]MCV3240145.1 DMT family transporter [Mesorhizobium sp. ZC-5]
MVDTAVIDTREKVFAGILLTSLAYLLFSFQDASIKLLVAGYSVWQILFFRSVTILVGCTAIGGRPLIRQSLASPIVKPMLLRSFIILSAWLCFYTAIEHLQLAELTTIYFAAPVIVTLLSVFILDEKVPLIRWVAVLLGFAGVYVACDPARLGLSVPVLLVLAAAFLWALSIVLLRKIALQERTLVQLVLNNGFFLVIAGLPMLWFWQMPSLDDALLLAGVGALGGLAQFMLFEGMKRAPVSIIAPFEYTSLVWSFILGYLIWQDVPRREVFFGAALIFCAGLLIIASEHFRKRILPISPP